MKRLNVLILCSVLSLFMAGCNKHGVSDKHHPEFNMELKGYVLDASSYAADGTVGFTTTWVSEDGSVGIVIPSKGLYFDVVEEVFTSNKELHSIVMKSKGYMVVYFEVDEVVYLDFVNSGAISTSKWFNLEDTRKKVVK